MKKIKKFHDWLAENGNAQMGITSIDNPGGFIYNPLGEGEASTATLSRQYSMNSTWWSAWRLENEKKDKLEISKDLFSNTYEVKKDGKLLLVYDYSKNKIFTNESPEKFMLKQDVGDDEMSTIQKKVEDIEDDLSGADPKAKEKEEEAAGEEETDATEEE